MKAISTGSGRYRLLIEVIDEPTIEEASTEGTAGVTDMADKLENISNAVASVCETLFDKALDALGNKKPKEFQIEFGITLAGKAGIPLVTEGSAECAIKVTAKWC